MVSPIMPYQVLIVGAGVRRERPLGEQLQPLYVELVLIDKSHGDLNYPLLYQVHSHQHDVDWAPNVATFNQSDNDAFVMMGEVVDINKEFKQVILANGDIIEYKYLIIAGGGAHAMIEHHPDEDYRAGLLALKEAHRIRLAVTATEKLSHRSDSLFMPPRKPLGFTVIDPSVGKANVGKAHRVAKGTKAPVLESSEANAAWFQHRVPCEVHGDF